MVSQKEEKWISLDCGIKVSSWLSSKPTFRPPSSDLNVKGSHGHLCFNTWFSAGDTVWGSWGTFRRWGVIGESRSLEDSGMSGFMVLPSWLCPDDPFLLPDCWSEAAEMWHSPMPSCHNGPCSSWSPNNPYFPWLDSVKHQATVLRKSIVHTPIEDIIIVVPDPRLASWRAKPQGTLALLKQVVVHKVQVQK